MDGTKDILKEIFQDEEVLKIISKNYIVFGLETGNSESNELSQEFDVKEIPFFGVVMAKSDTEYDIIGHYNDENVEIEKFKDFLEGSHGTYKSLAEILVNIYQTQHAEPENFQNAGFVDARHQEDRQIMQQQRQEFEKAKKEDRIKFEKQRLEAEAKAEAKAEAENKEEVNIGFNIYEHNFSSINTIYFL